MSQELLSDVLMQDGEGLLAVVAATEHLGHETPASLLTYFHGEPNAAMDLILWTTKRPGWESARERLVTHCEETGARRRAVARLAAPFAELFGIFLLPAEPARTASMLSGVHARPASAGGTVGTAHTGGGARPAGDSETVA